MGADDERATEPGRAVGLGRVVNDPGGLGRDAQPADDDASEDSFPASDPPAYASDGTTPGDHGSVGRADPEPGAPDADDLPGTELPDPEDRV